MAAAEETKQYVTLDKVRKSLKELRLESKVQHEHRLGTGFYFV
jgi:hypothetical protein